MQKRVKFDHSLKTALANKATEIELPPDMWDNVKAQLLEQENKSSKAIYGINFGSYWFFGQPMWKKAIACTLGVTLFFGGLTLGISPQARAWAAEKMQTIIPIRVMHIIIGEEESNTVHVPVPIRDGDPDPSKVKITITDGTSEISTSKTGEFEIRNLETGELEKGKILDHDMTTTEAEAVAGFPLSLPAYLPKGYEQIGLYADKEYNGKGYVEVDYQRTDQEQPELGLRLFIDNDIDNEKKYLRGGDAVKEVKIGEKVGYCYEYPLFSNSDDTEPAVTTGQMLKWQANNIVYTLCDNESELSLEEMVKLAESVK